MAPNVALRQARVRAHMSQGDAARAVREWGFRAGLPVACNERTWQRWESGQVTRPQARYLLALEEVLGQSAESLGFEASERYGMDRDQMIADAGLDAAMPLPDPAGSYGPLTGIWLSEYEYPSSGRGEALIGRHYAIVFQRGAHLTVRSVPASKSQLSMELNVNGQVLTGTWTERTDPGGYYRGAVYSGALQMLLDPTGHRMEGEWVGFGRDMKVNHGVWALTLVSADVGRDAVERWNRDPRIPAEPAEG
jgi:transcriptional regulator with XRE-family HTH domain